MSSEQPKILVIDDQAAIREIVADLISEFELAEQVEMVSSIDQARQLLCNQHWSAIISDMSLADGNALDLFESMKQQDQPLPPILLMSGFLFDTTEDRAHALGIRHILHKPFMPNDLIDSVQQLLTGDDIVDA